MLSRGQVGSSPGRTGGWQLYFNAPHLLGAQEVILFSGPSLCSGASLGALPLPPAAAWLQIPCPQHPPFCLCGMDCTQCRRGGEWVVGGARVKIQTSGSLAEGPGWTCDQLPCKVFLALAPTLGG